MRFWGGLCILALAFRPPVFARLETALCGTHPLKLKEGMFLHRQTVRKRAVSRAAAAPPPAVVTQDIGNIAVLDAGAGALVARNQFDLDGRTLAFLPASANAGSYQFQLGDPSYDADTAGAGSQLALADDDTVGDCVCPFPFRSSVKFTNGSS